MTEVKIDCLNPVKAALVLTTTWYKYFLIWGSSWSQRRALKTDFLTNADSATNLF